MRVLRPVLAIAAKDIVQRSRDRSAYIMGIVGPLALVFILNGTLGAVDEPAAFELGFVDADGGAAAAGFLATLADLDGDRVIELTVADDRAALEQLVDDGELAAGFVVPAGFTRTIEQGGTAEITVVGDPGSSVAVDVADAIAAAFAAELDYVSVATGSVLTAAGGAVAPEQGDEIAAEALAIAPPIELDPTEAEGRGSDLASYYAVSLSVFFLFFTVQFGVLSLMEEREGGTLSRIVVAPVTPAAVLVGKMVSSLVIGLVTMVVLAVATTIVVGASWGSPLAVGILIVFGVVTAIAVAVMVAAFARTAEQASAYASIAALVLGLLGGTFFQISRASGLLATISYVSPHRWLLDGFRDVSYGASIAELGPTLAVLSGFIVVVGGVGLVSAGRGLVRP